MGNSAGVKALFAQIGASGNESLNIRLQNAEQAITAVSVKAETKTRTFVQPDQPVDGAEEVGALIIGDQWVDTDDNNKLYGWSAEGWQPVSDGRFGVLNRVFVQESAPTADPLFPFNLGDLWFDSDDGFKQHAWDGAAWVLIADTRIAASALAVNELDTSVGVINGQITAQANQITSLTATVGTKSATFTQPFQPTGIPLTTGDLWIDTDDGNRTFVWNGTTWVDRSDSRFSSRNRVFAQISAPTNDGTLIVNDLWVDTDDGNKLYRWDGSTWTNISDGRIAANTAAINTEATTRANQDSSLADQINTVSTTVGTNTATITQQQTSIDGLTARAFLKLDVNGRVVGYEVNNSGITSDFTITADRFRVDSPSSGNVVLDTQSGASFGRVDSKATWIIKGNNAAFAGQTTVADGRIVASRIRTSRFSSQAQFEAISTFGAGTVNFASVSFVVDDVALQMGYDGGSIGIFDNAGTLIMGRSFVGPTETPMFRTNAMWHAGNFAPSPGTGNIPQWNGSSWVAAALAFAPTANPTFSGTATIPTLSVTSSASMNNATITGAAFVGTVWRDGVVQPRIFVQSNDPGAAAVDGDLWFW